MWRARSLQRKRIGPAMSAARGNPAQRDRARDPLPGAGLVQGPALISVSTQPGATQFTVMDGPHSTQSDLVSEMMAPLVAA